MQNNGNKINCIIHCRVSSAKQAQQGDSLDAQEKAGRRMAERNGWKVIKVFYEPYSGRKTSRPLFNEIKEYIKNSPIKIHKYIFKSINRITRAGAAEFLWMKKEIEKSETELVDSYGIIQPKQNRLEYLGVDYEWAYFSPTEAAELLEAKRAEDDAKDTLVKLIEAEIVLVRKGFKVRQAKDGMMNVRIYVDGKKRVAQVGDPDRQKYFIEMLKARAAHTLTDQEIVDKVNAMGYKSKIQNVWNKEHTKIIGHRGGVLLTVKQLQKVIQRVDYIGYNCEKWTNYKPLKLIGSEGIVDIETFNKANRGKVCLKINEDGTAELIKNYDPIRSKKRLKDNPLFPYSFIRCPLCKEVGLDKSFTHGSPRNGSGVNTPTYCHQYKHKYFGVNKIDFDKNVEKFINNLKFDPDFLNSLELSFINKYKNRQKEIVSHSAEMNLSISELKTQKAATLEAFVAAQNQTTRKELDEQVERLETQIKEVEKQRLKLDISENDIKWFMGEAKKIMERPAKMLLDPKTTSSKEAMFSLVFEEIPTYHEIVNGTAKLHWIFKLSSEFETNKGQLVRPLGFEPRTIRLRGDCSTGLSYGRNICL